MCVCVWNIHNTHIGVKKEGKEEKREGKKAEREVVVAVKKEMEDMTSKIAGIVFSWYLFCWVQFCSLVFPKGRFSLKNRATCLLAYYVLLPPFHFKYPFSGIQRIKKFFIFSILPSKIYLFLCTYIELNSNDFTISKKVEQNYWPGCIKCGSSSWFLSKILQLLEV